MLSGSEVAKHKAPDSCWMVIHGRVYDVTKFLDKHPGGRAILLRQAGADATPEFDKIHSVEVLQDLPDGSNLGELDPSTAKALSIAVPEAVTTAAAADSKKVRPLALCVRASDFRSEAKKVLNRRSWTYISSSANSGHSMQGNLDSWGQVTFRPRVMRNVASVSARTSFLGHPSVVPFFVGATGTMGMAHPGAEIEMMHGLVRKGVHAVISTASSKTWGDIMDFHAQELVKVGGAEENPARLFFQLYIPTDRQKAVELVQRVKEAGYRGLFITVDTNVLGKRTADRRKQAEESLEDGKDHSTTSQPAGAEGNENKYAPAVGARPVPGQLSPMVNWEDLEWIRKEWSGPIVLKGIQTAEDARLAAENDCQGILLSNHGGRQQHSAPNGLATLLEIRAYCPEVLEKLEVYIDGGCRDGADILKALALGATAVGFGRPFLYAMAAYGSAGVQKLVDILTEELTIGMALLGVTAIDQLRPEMVNAQPLINNMWRPELPSILSRL
ncbi:L-lactate dehydrogenase [Cryphonectria parasitica EP155]|uniref:L-lactate dehydrogenase n=1 Tax=Cryphonectria parasitica (strain ATCC 38755 / EP155) TaxID=660469 RepID=A0A9P4Y5V7_CRYP1|nr:L-lactate dehydrogenase [Cryphonectria parasitica EP155]KAF3767065.1 L-lactate dehydrogenase [Cryphonectria parasitica EP155]